MNKVSGLLGLAKRSHAIVSGEMVFNAIQKKEAKLAILSNNIGENNKKKILDKCYYYHVPVVYMDENVMNEAIGEYNRKVLVIKNEGFANKLYTYLKG